jgi:hypothetical protein
MVRAVVIGRSAVFVNELAGDDVAGRTDSGGPILDAFLTGTA